MEQKIYIFKYILFFFIIFFNYSISSKTIIGKAYIIDGDTIHIDNNKIRLHAIDAPEIQQTCTVNNQNWKCGIKSKEALVNLIGQKEVNCETIGIDKYKRFIAECYINKKNINEYMVLNGWAIAYRYYSKKFVQVENKAKKNKLGIWRGSFIDPYVFRKNN